LHKDISEIEKGIIENLKTAIGKDLRDHLEDGEDGTGFYIEDYRKTFCIPGLRLDRVRMNYLLLEALKEATIELQIEWANAAA